MPRIIGPTILAIGIICAPVIFAGMPSDKAHSQVPSMHVPLMQAPSIKGDRLNVKPARAEIPVRSEVPVRVAGLTRVVAIVPTHLAQSSS